jgi:hypothetical protein
MTRFSHVLPVVIVALALSVPNAQGQIQVTESDARSLVGEQVALQVFTAENPSSFASFFDQSGEGVTFDFTPYQYELSFSGFQEGWEASNAPSDVPFLDRFTDRGANVVFETRFEARQAAETDSTFWQFLEITSSEESLVGFTALFSRDLDQDGEQPDSVRAEWTPARTIATLPLTDDKQWSQKTDLSFSPSVLPTISSDRQSEVDGYGTLKTPVGSAPALRIREETVDTVSIAGNQQITRSTTLQFTTKDGRLGASITRDEDTGEITGASVTVRAGEGGVFSISEGGTPTLDDVPGVKITLTDGSESAGSLGVSRFDTAPFNTAFTGSATSDDGSSVDPNVLWEGQYFVVRNRGLQNFSADVCIDISSTPGISDTGKLVMLTREAADQGWSPLDSNLDGNDLCATVSSFSQFAVGGNSSSNPLPVELARFEAQRNGEGAVHLTWQTASETNNSGFDVQRQTGSGNSASWTTVDFVEGAGSTSEPQSYQFTDRTVPFEAETVRYRLRQVDLDGTTDLSRVVEVNLGTPEELALRAPFPNPFQDQATVRYELPRATDVQVAVYDLLGRRVATPVDGQKTAGRAQFQLRTQDLPSGTYFLRLQAAEQTRTQRLTIVE